MQLLKEREAQVKEIKEKLEMSDKDLELVKLKEQYANNTIERLNSEL